MPFEKLPDRISGINSQDLYRAIPVERPQVYDTEKLLHPLMTLADYLSPVKKAQRKAAVAKANYDYRTYMPGGLAEKNALWMNQLRSYQQKAAMLHYANELAKSKAVKASPLTPAQQAWRAKHNMGPAARGPDQDGVDQATEVMDQEQGDLSDLGFTEPDLPQVSEFSTED